MSVEFNSPYTVFIDEAERRVTVLDQRLLPHRVEHVDLKNAQEAAEAIRGMTVRGAPLIGVTGAAGMALAADESTETGFLIEAANLLKSARPTAVNLNWAVDFMLKRLKGMEPSAEFRPQMPYKCRPLRFRVPRSQAFRRCSA